MKKKMNKFYWILFLLLFIFSCQKECNCNLSDDYYWKMHAFMEPINDREDTEYRVNKELKFSNKEIDVLAKILLENNKDYILTINNEVFVSKLTVPDKYSMYYLYIKYKDSMKNQENLD